MNNLIENATKAAVETLVNATSSLGWPEPMPGNSTANNSMSPAAEGAVAGVAGLVAVALAGRCLWKRCCQKSENSAAATERTSLSEPVNPHNVV